jgi:hypothetical protein
MESKQKEIESKKKANQNVSEVFGVKESCISVDTYQARLIPDREEEGSPFGL